MTQNKALRKTKPGTTKYLSLTAVLAIAFQFFSCLIFFSGTFSCLIDSYLSTESLPEINDIYNTEYMSVMFYGSSDGAYLIFSVCLAASLVAGISQYTFLHKKARLTAVLSMPEKREHIFLKRAALPAIALTVSTVISILPLFIVNVAGFGLNEPLIKTALMELFCLLSVSIFGYTVGIIASLFSHETYEAAVISVAAAALPIMVFNFAERLTSDLIKGFTNEASLRLSIANTLLNPLFPIYYQTSSWYASESSLFCQYGLLAKGTVLPHECTVVILASVFHIAVSVFAIFAASKYFSNKFTSENAEKPLNSKLTLFAVGTLSFFTVLWLFMASGKDESTPYLNYGIQNILIASAVSLCTSGIIVYLGKKKPLLWLSSALSPAAAATALLMVCVFAGSSIETTLPKADKVSSVVISSFNLKEILPYAGIDDTTDYFPSYESSFLFDYSEDIDILLNINKEIISSKSDSSEYTPGCSIEFIYFLKDGTRVTRSYNPEEIGNSGRKAFLNLFKTDMYKKNLERYLYEGLLPSMAMLNNQQYAVYSGSIVMSPQCNSLYMYIERNDMTVKDVSGLINENTLKLLKDALKKDYAEMTVAQKFLPSEKQLFTLKLSAFDISKQNTNETEYQFYNDAEFTVYSYMKNTLNVLKNADILKYTNDIRKPVSAELIDYDEYCALKSNDSPMLFSNVDLYMKSDSNAATKITDKTKLNKLYGKCLTNCYSDTNGSVAAVTFDDGSVYLYYYLGEELK